MGWDFLPTCLSIPKSDILYFCDTNAPFPEKPQLSTNLSDQVILKADHVLAVRKL